MTEKEVNEYLYKIFEDCEDTKYSEGMSFYFDGSTPLFELEIEGKEGESFTIIYRPPMKYLRELIEATLDSERITKNVAKVLSRQGKTLDKTLLSVVVEGQKEEMFQPTAARAMTIVRCFESVFRQAALEVTDLYNALDEVHFGKTRDRLKRVIVSRTKGNFHHAALEAPPFDVDDVKARFAKKHKEIGKKIFQHAISILPADLPPKRFLFYPIYKHLLPVWQEAQKFYKEHNNKSKWREMIAIGFEEHDLPADLIEKLESLDKQEKMPSNLALIHTARLCEIREVTAHRTLQLYRKESQQWVEESAPYKVEELINVYKVPANFHPNIINAESDELM